MIAPRKNNRNYFSVQSRHSNLNTYPARTSVNLSLGNASNNFFSYKKTFKSGPPNPFVVEKNMSQPRKGGLNLGYVKEQATKEKGDKNISGSGEKDFIGSGDESKLSKLAFLHPVKVNVSVFI